MKHLFLFITCSFLLGCSKTSTKLLVVDSITVINQPKQNMSFNHWWSKDIKEDTIPGISLDKAYRDLLANKVAKDIIVAVIDTEVDLNHEDLKGSFWLNTGEIQKNGIDDDHNGYVDDINGWNFLGNKKGENIVFPNYEFIRIIRKFDSIFKEKKESEIDQKLKDDYLLYQKAIKLRSDKLESIKKNLVKGKSILKKRKDAFSFFETQLGTTEFKIDQINKFEAFDSITKVYKKNMLLFLNRGLTEDVLQNYVDQQIGANEKSSNIEYYDRTITGDDENNIDDKKYGNPYVSKNLKELYHGTLVSGILSANRDDTIGIRGISDNIRIMPLAISANGDENDKDIALAIRYAVDNGAKVINMSSGKQFSMHKKWVQDALIYADQKGVLFITSAGNDNLNLDFKENNYYPNDRFNNSEKEISESFIMVGASSNTLNNNFKYVTSSYGKKDVDLFAPGINVETTIPNNSYRMGNATSVATPIVSGIAALVWSYYPELTAKQIKQILMQSGTTYNIDVEIKQENGVKKIVPFSELSKSGKIVNAYNALLMAEKMVNVKE